MGKEGEDKARSTNFEIRENPETRNPKEQWLTKSLPFVYRRAVSDGKAEDLGRGRGLRPERTGPTTEWGLVGLPLSGTGLRDMRSLPGRTVRKAVCNWKVGNHPGELK
jgi:hypothetical protein